ncbi:hypothetical protein ACJJTC_005321 [Scirpophaga incertulas]
MGDFNTCLLKNDSRSSSLHAVLRSTNLYIPALNATHHFPNCSPSLLDLILVSSLDHLVSHDQCPADSFSYHDAIYLSYKIRPLKSKPKILQLRNFSSMNVDKLCEDASNIDWLALYTSKSVDEKVDIFVTKIMNLYNIHAPVRNVKLKQSPSPWLTQEIKMLIDKKAAYKTKYKHRSTVANWENYVNIRNHCNKVCRNAQRHYFQSSVENRDPAKVWKFLQSMGIGKARQTTVPDGVDLNSLNTHFTSASNFTGATKASTSTRRPVSETGASGEITLKKDGPSLQIPRL